MNARQQLTAATYGSKLAATYGYDASVTPAPTITVTVQDYRYAFNASTGNLTSRQNYKRGISESFTYDNLDRLLTATGPQTISYNSFSKVSSISETNGSQRIDATFAYNSDNQRAKMSVRIYYGAEILTRYYAGGSYMKEIQPNTSNEYTYLGGDAYTAPVVVHNKRGEVSYYYLLRSFYNNQHYNSLNYNPFFAEFGIGMRDFLRNYSDMRQVNWKDSDK